jgi:predicted P-loop ATPase
MRSQAAIAFLLKWAPDSQWLLSAIEPERVKPMITQSFDISTADNALAFVEQWNGKRNLYFTVNVPRLPQNKKAKKEHIGWMQAVHVDVDPADPAQGADAQEHNKKEGERILTALRAYEPKPSIIIFSGGGYQGFWLLREPAEIEEPSEKDKAPWAKFEAHNRTPEKKLGGDHCFNIDRIMRLPGTVNLPDAKKRAKGRVEAVAEVVDADWDALYELTDFPVIQEEKKIKTPKRAKNDDWVERVLQSGPDHEGDRSFGGDRSKAVWAILCALVRRGWTDEEILEAITDKKNKLSEHVYDQNNPIKYAERQVARARETVGEDFLRDEKDKIIVNQENIRKALLLLEVKLTHNEFSRKDIIEGPRGMPKRTLEDNDLVQLRLMIEEECYFRVSKEYFGDVILNECKANKFHPVREYLDNLKYDGKKRIDTWLIDYAGVEDSPYIRAISAIVLIAAVRRIRQPGVKFDEMLVFESAQGLDKSSAIKALAVRDEWYSDSLSLDASEKEIIETLDGKWLVEGPELKGLRGKGMEHMKAFLSRQVDRARLSYGRLVTEAPRQSIIISTTNSNNYLSDNTGNRRIWPVAIKKFDVKRLRADVDLLWAEANAREAAGESIRLDPDLYPNAADEQEERFVEDPWTTTFEKAFADTPTGKIASANVWMLTHLPIGQRTQYHNVRLGDVMRALGWKRTTLSFNGKVGRCYAKGNAQERMQEIDVVKDETGRISLEYKMSIGPEGTDRDIPF